MNDVPTVLVATALTWSSTVALPRLLFEAGLRVTGMSPGPLGLCPHVATHRVTSRDPQRAANDVITLLERRSFDWVVIADDVLLEALLARDADRRAAAWAPFDRADPAIGRFLLSKHAFIEDAGRFGIPIPPSCLVSSVDHALAFAAELDYPIVVRGDRGFAGTDVSVATSPLELRRGAAASIERYGRAAVQHFVRGSSISVSVVFASGVPLAMKAYRTECGFPTSTSASTRHAHFAHPEIEAIVRRIGARTGFDGMAGIDFMHDSATNELFAIEVNPRPTLGFSGADANRAFFAPAIRRFLRGDGETLDSYDGREPVQSYFPGHLFFALTHPRETDARSVRAACAEFRPSDWRTASWEIARFARDRLALAVPRFALAARLESIELGVAPR